VKKGGPDDQELNMSEAVTKSLNEGVHVVSDTALNLPTGANLAPRYGGTTVSQAINAYMMSYVGRDATRAQRMEWWETEIGHMRIDEVEQDHIYFALERLTSRDARYWAGRDADGKPIFKSKNKPYAPATINRYAATIGALFTWCVKKRLPPKGWEHPCRGIERLPENNEIVRFLSNEERISLLSACKVSKWPKLYLLVLMAITTGARRGELENLRWSEINFDRCEATIQLTKNGDRKVLPLMPAVMAELNIFRKHNDSLVFASTRCPDQPYNHVPMWSKALKEARIKKFRLHDLRHTCASYLAQNGATLLEIGDVLGQRQVSVTKRYSHLTTGHKTALVSRVLGNIS
jgi:integrase